MFVGSLVLAAFSLGILLGKPAMAQAIPLYGQGFPHQSDLWSFSASASSYLDTGTIHGYVFQVSTDSNGRLPVLTTSHLDGYSGSFAYGDIYHNVGGQWQKWERNDMSFGGSSTPLWEGRFHNSGLGVVLQTGSYLITYGQGSNQLLLSGYYARP
jgi:hypothetical protein